MRRRNLLGAILAAPLILPLPGRARDAISTVVIDGGPYVPTPNVVVDRMLEFDVPEKAALMLSPRTQLFLYRIRRAD